MNLSDINVVQTPGMVEGANAQAALDFVGGKAKYAADQVGAALYDANLAKDLANQAKGTADWATAQFPAMNAATSTAKTIAESAEGKATQAQIDLAAVGTAIDQINAAITALQSDGTANGQAITSLTSAVQNLQTSATALGTNVTDLWANIAAKDAQLSEIERKFMALAVHFGYLYPAEDSDAYPPET